MTEEEIKLTSLHNIGENLAEKLKMVGIVSPHILKSIGSENAFIRIKAIDHSACINMLYALEGAIQGVRWHKLEIARINELKSFFKQLEK